MKSFAFHLQKGGVGKTSLSVSTASEMAGYGKTILIDVDPQGNASSWLLSESPEFELAAVLTGQIDVDKVIQHTPARFDLIPTFGLNGKLKTYGENQLANEPFILCDLSDALEKLGYKYAIFDLSPGMGRLERSVLVAATYAITPMTPEIFSLDGIEIFTSELEDIRKSLRQAAKHTHIVANAFDSRISQHKQILSKIQSLPGYTVLTVPVDPVFRKAQAMNSVITALSGTNAAKKETVAAIQELAASLRKLK